MLYIVTRRRKHLDLQKSLEYQMDLQIRRTLRSQPCGSLYLRLITSNLEAARLPMRCSTHAHRAAVSRLRFCPRCCQAFESCVNAPTSSGNGQQIKLVGCCLEIQPEKHTARSLFDGANEKIMTVLEHDIMLPPAGDAGDLILAPVTLELLTSLIDSARRQNIEQLMTRWLSPLKRTRSHVRKYLVTEVGKSIALQDISDEGDSNEAQGSNKIVREIEVCKTTYHQLQLQQRHRYRCQEPDFGRHCRYQSMLQCHEERHVKVAVLVCFEVRSIGGHVRRCKETASRR
jgi:hypothetical protein